MKQATNVLHVQQDQWLQMQWHRSAQLVKLEPFTILVWMLEDVGWMG
jgi:hypothetical protein